MVGNAVKPVVVSQPWMAAKEWADAGFEDTQPAPREPEAVDGEDDVDAEEPMVPAASSPGHSPAPAVPVPAAPTAEEASVGEALAEKTGAGELDRAVEQFFVQLRVGSRVDMHSAGQWLRAELVWASARGTLFMFTSPGGRAHSMTKRSCEKLIRSKGLRLAEVRAVVETALAQVAHQPPRAKRSTSVNTAARLVDPREAEAVNR